MKHLLLAFVLLTLVGCSSETREQELVRAWLKDNANDPSSVEIIEIGHPWKHVSGPYAGAIVVETKYRQKNKAGVMELCFHNFIIENNKVIFAGGHLQKDANGRFQTSKIID